MPRDWDASKDTENNVPVHIIDSGGDAVKDFLPPGTKVVDITLHLGVKIEMRKLVNKYPNGYADFKDTSKLDAKLTNVTEAAPWQSLAIPGNQAIST
ncbi:hypothetical protein V499_06869 [Pseudogymnoascus sp. VKM F-103]|nr:hypothetical protein V499_06869 [Pseudogymnoascus sp. VKM F-103]